MSIDVVYTAESTATGGGRDGHVKSADGKIDLDDATAITAQIGFGKDSEGGFGISAHLVCPYSKATRGNVDVTLSAKV